MIATTNQGMFGNSITTDAVKMASNPVPAEAVNMAVHLESRAPIVDPICNKRACGKAVEGIVEAIAPNESINARLPYSSGPSNRPTMTINPNAKNFDNPLAIAITEEPRMICAKKFKFFRSPVPLL